VVVILFAALVSGTTVIVGFALAKRQAVIRRDSKS
jgi:hypothetical protein